MTDILRTYEQQYGILYADITANISKSVREADKSGSIVTIENLFSEAKEIIEQMELEIRDTNSANKRTPDQKEKYLTIINSYKTELSKLELEFNRQVKTKSNNFEIQLNESREDSELNDMKEQNHSILNKMNNNLQNSYKMVLETEETGKGILSDLFGQREQIQRSRDRLREANTNLGKSSRIVSTMTRKLMQNKIILIGLVIFLILFVIFIIYYVATRNAD